MTSSTRGCLAFPRKLRPIWSILHLIHHFHVGFHQNSILVILNIKRDWIFNSKCKMHISWMCSNIIYFRILNAWWFIPQNIYLLCPRELFTFTVGSAFCLNVCKWYRKAKTHSPPSTRKGNVN
ncbi:hypothetical protein KSS87_023465 [Heliosperma pusillum]|nr:hypothetical protein KSS87_013609 [Heliosperma pusillum]KAH9621363.1 hypothetical protein KSS87_023465 [Heliosperma pusillum]